jgi:adenosylhomocysteine nucleosidase
MNHDCIVTFHDAGKAPVRILFVMATDAEYGAELKSLGVSPAIVGVGPIEAAINTTALLRDMEREGQLPDLVINMGSGGSRQLDYKTIAQATLISYRDMDASPFGFEKGQTPFSELPVQLPVQARIPGLPETTVSTGGNVISGQAYESFAEQTAEMEAYAIYSASLKFGIPMLKLVGISDGKEVLTGQCGEWTRYLADIDQGFAVAIATLKEGLESGKICRQELLSLPPLLRHKIRE